jgi:hypothetical protein
MPWNGIDSLPQSFDPTDGPPKMLETMVPFYEAYIPLMCEGDPVKLAAALEALKQRNTFLVEDILDGGSRIRMVERLQAKAQARRVELTEEEEIAILVALGYDVGDD